MYVYIYIYIIDIFILYNSITLNFYMYSYGERGQWNEVPHCRSLELTWCDLTNQTQDLEHGYFARVRAADQSGFSKWKVTQQRFDPKSDSKWR